MNNPVKKQGISKTYTNKQEQKVLTKGENFALEKIEKVESMLNINVEEVIRGYNPDYISILTMDETKIKPELRELLHSFEFQLEDRTICEFATNLMLSWILEDSLADRLEKELKIKINKNGTDAIRHFSKNPKSDTDLLINHNNKEYHLEVVVDYKKYWRYNPIDLRDKKLTNLIKKTKKADKVFVLGLCIGDDKIGLVEIEKGKEYDETQTYNRYWRRMVQKLPINYKKDFHTKKNFGDVIRKNIL